VAALSTTDIFEFDRFRLDRRGLFRRDGDAALAPVEIGSRALEVLRALLERPGDLVSRDEIMAAAWPGIVVEDNNLTIQIASLRRVLDQDRANGSCIQTVTRRGYRFVGRVTRVEPEARPTPRLSIVVLPFANLGNDPEQQYFADGITEDLTTDLSRIDGAFVISCNTAFTYRNKPVDTKQIGRELRVRYVLEGSVRRWGNQIRVTAQLIDAETDAHLWADRFDRDAADMFALQNEITNQLANALRVELIAVEAARPTEHPDVLDYILRGRAALWKPLTQKTYTETIKLFEHALTLDPRSVEAQYRLAAVLVNRVTNGMSYSAAADLSRADGLVGQALAASPRNALAYHVKGRVLRAQSVWEEAIPEYETALAMNGNLASTLQGLATCKLFTGSIEEVIPLVEKAIRLSPHDPSIGFWYLEIGAVHLLQSRIDEAIVWVEKARREIPSVPTVRSVLAAAYALRDDAERAAFELTEARKLNGGNLFSSIAHVRASSEWGVPKIRALFEATFFAGLRKAGMPEE